MRLTGKELAEKLNVSPATLSQAVANGHYCGGEAVASWAVRSPSGRVVGYDVPPRLSARRNPSEPAREVFSPGSDGAPSRDVVVPEVKVSPPAVHVAPPAVHVTTPEVRVEPQITVEQPEIHVAPPAVHVTTPEVRVEPRITVEQPEIHVAVPPAPMVHVEVKVELPERGERDVNWLLLGLGVAGLVGLCWWLQRQRPPSPALAPPPAPEGQQTSLPAPSGLQLDPYLYPPVRTLNAPWGRSG